MAGNFFADVGLGYQGADAERLAQARLDEEAQQLRVREQGLEDAKARSPLIGQAVRAGSRTEAEQQRIEANATAQRAAVAGAGSGLADVQTAVGTAAKTAGDAAGYQKAQENLAAAQKQGFDVLAKGAVGGLPTSEVETQFNRLGESRIAPGTLEYGKDPKTGDVLVRGVSPKDNKPYTFNASAYLRLGTKPDVHIVPAGGSIAESGAGRQTTIIPGPPDRERFAPNTRITHLKIYNEDGQVTGERLVTLDASGQPVATAGTDQGGSAPSGERSVSKALPELKDATHALLQIPGMATKANPDNPMDTQLTLTAQGQAIMPRLEAVVMANRKVPAHQALLIAMHGKPGQDADGKPVVQYGGKVYPLSGGGGTPVEKPAPRARATTGPLNTSGEVTQIPENELAAYEAARARERAGIDSAGKPYDYEAQWKRDHPGGEPYPSRNAIATPAAASAPTPSQAGLPPLLDAGKGADMTPAERMRARNVAMRQEQEQRRMDAPKRRIADTFRVMLKEGYRKADAPLIQEAIDTGMLTPTEIATARTMLAKTSGFARGGMVTAYGLA